MCFFKKNKAFLLYLLKWQLGSLILIPTVNYLSNYGTAFSVVVGNLIGGIIFYPIDKKIFK